MLPFARPWVDLPTLKRKCLDVKEFWNRRLPAAAAAGFAAGRHRRSPIGILAIQIVTEWLWMHPIRHKTARGGPAPSASRITRAI